jgi:hypothetical protein
MGDVMQHSFGSVALFAALIAPITAAGQQLGPAPLFTGPEPAPRAVVKALGAGNPIDNLHRGEAVGHFFSRWWPYTNVPALWTGSVATCNSGTISQARYDATIATVNYYRALTALPDTVTLDETLNAGDQRMALMIGANSQLSHFPPSSWACYSVQGADAASHSNLAYGVSGPDAIDLYMDDPGPGNTAAGHRRWILYPPQAQMGSGDVEGPNTVVPANALNVIQGFGSRPATPSWVAWPPPGYVPYWLMPASSNRWSFSYSASFPGADLTAATVTMNRAGTPIPVVYESVENGYGDNTRVFLPQGISYAAPAADTTYDVTVDNVVVGGVPRSFSYSVTVFKPVKPPKLADFDNDGQSDLVWNNAGAQQTATWFMKGGAIVQSAFGAVPPGWTLRAAADIDGDGKADLVWTNAATNQVAVWFMNGATVAASSFFGTGAGWDLAAVADLNGDGKADLIFRNTSGAMIAWLMSKAGIVTTVNYPSVGSDWTIAGTGDFTGARKDQILWRYVPTGDLFLWTNADTAAVSIVGLGKPGASWQLRAVGDVDGDGLADLVWRSAIGENAIWLGGLSGHAVFPPGVGTDWSIIGSAQVYGDGRANVVWQRNDGVVAHWRFDATLAPSATFLTTVPAGWSPLSM